MLTHIVVWKYKDEVSEETRKEHRAKLLNLKSIIAEVVDFTRRFGRAQPGSIL
jgi:hypothetical protein